LLWLCIVLFVAGGGVALWWWYQSGAGTVADVASLRTQVETLTHDVTQLRRNADTLRARLDDGDKVDKSMREQLLSLGERTHLLEDALANLADKRLSGHDALALDEAELLLTLGGERYVLFHDAAAAMTAYRAADTVLSEVEDPAFSTVRQSIGAEITALSDTHAADAAALVARFDRLRAQSAQLPLATHAAAPAPIAESGVWRALGAFVQIRHDDNAQTLVALHAPTLARELYQLDLRDAEAAAAARDETRYRAAMASARAQFGAAFDPQAPAYAAAVTDLDALTQAVLAPAPPAAFGAALKELRNLRATHALRERPAASPQGAAK
jgi:uroporphyrin-3 C-methyltransferase